MSLIPRHLDGLGLGQYAAGLASGVAPSWIAHLQSYLSLIPAPCAYAPPQLFLNSPRKKQSTLSAIINPRLFITLRNICDDRARRACALCPEMVVDYPRERYHACLSTWGLGPTQNRTHLLIGWEAEGRDKFPFWVNGVV